MGKSAMELSMSLDGYISGPDDGPAHGLGDGGDRLSPGMKQGAPRFSSENRPSYARLDGEKAAIMREDLPT